MACLGKHSPAPHLPSFAKAILAHCLSKSGWTVLIAVGAKPAFAIAINPFHQCFSNMPTGLLALLKPRSLSASLVGCILALTTASPAQALTIVRNFIGGNPAPEAFGGGNIVDVFNAAADTWEAAIQDDYTLTLDYAWEARRDRSLASYSSRGRDREAPFRNIKGLIRFNNDDRYSWFIDPTPWESSEYQTLSTASQDFGQGEINVERRWISPTGDAIGHFDLYNVALHEIGHGLNVLSRNRQFKRETMFDKDIDLTAPRPFAGSSIPITRQGGGHLKLSEAVLSGFVAPGQRRMLSEADILASAQVSNFTDINLNPQLMSPETPPQQSVPEGNFALALLLSAGVLGASRKLDDR